MCRWLAYSGPSIFLEDLIVKPQRSLLVQSRFARENYVTGLPGIPDGAFPTNGDGFGIGWYGERDFPGRYRDLRPAWSDRNLIDLAAQIKSGLFLAHLRAAYNGEVQRTNSHPFRYKQWLFQHNGEISDFNILKRDLQMAVEPELFKYIEGTTDTETVFYLAITLGLETQAKTAMQNMVDLVEEKRTAANISDPFRLTCTFSDGDHLYAIRYSSDQASKSLYINKDQSGLEEIASSVASSTGKVLLSEPLDECSGCWTPIEENSFVTVFPNGDVDISDFRV